MDVTQTVSMTGHPMQMIKQMAKPSTVILMLAVLLIAGITAGPAMVQDLLHAGAMIPPVSSGSQPVVVDWSLFIGHDDQYEADSTKKCGGRARWADRTDNLSRFCAVTQ
jgi:hypothetical protein